MAAPEAQSYEAPPGTSAAKAAVLGTAHRYLAANRVDTFTAIGVPLVIDRREGYRFWDLDGHELLDLHLNGGVFNLGHRHPDVVAALVAATERYDIGNHHFPSEPKVALADELVAVAPGDRLERVVFTPSGGEAIDVAIRSARRATGRRAIVAWDCAFHGRTGLSGATGDPKTAASFLSDQPADLRTVPYGDLDALAATLDTGDVAAVLAEVIPATAGFVPPPTGFYPAVRELCDRHGTLLIADEVQTGLGRSGRAWALEHFGADPDILVTGKGLSGGMYPISATLLSAATGAWLLDDGWGYVSTFGGSDLGCEVARTALALSVAPDTLARVAHTGERFAEGFARIAAEHPFLVEVRRCGVIMGLRFDDRLGAISMARALYEAGVWAMFSGFDASVLQWKPGLLVDDAWIDQALERFETAISAVEHQRGTP
jgi:acetylornithine/succinyldiaminopimelate/putrescine aminotransferase